MRVVIVTDSEFCLIPESTEELADMNAAQKSLRVHPNMLYFGCGSGHNDFHLRFNVGGKKKNVTKRLSANCTSTESKPVGGTTFFVRPHGENMTKAFNLIRGHGFGSSTITVEPYSDGLRCIAKLHPHFDPTSKEYRGRVKA
jgi:hypothetical protein